MDQILNRFNSKYSERQSKRIFILFSIFSIAYFIYLAFSRNIDFFVGITFLIIGMLATLILASSKNVLSLKFFNGVFSYIMFFMAPFHQYVFKENIWNILTFTKDDYLYTNFVVIIFLMCFIFGYWLYERKNKDKPRTFMQYEVNLNNNQIVFLTIFNVLLAIGLYIFVGREALSTRYFTFGDTIKDFIFISFLPKISLPIFVLSLLQFLKKRQWLYIASFVINFVVFLILNPFSGISRSFLLVVLFIIIGFYDKKFNNKDIVFALILIGLIVIMPFMNYFKSFDIKDITRPFDFKHPDYDSYEILMTSIRYTKENGFTNGNNILTAFFFLIPRSIWPGKGLNSGQMIFIYFNSTFTNVSCPLPAEFYLAGGIWGVLFLSIIIGFFFAFIDQLYYKKSFLSTGFLFVVLGMFFSIFRGSMLQTVVYTFALILSFVSVWVLMNLFNASPSSTIYYYDLKEKNDDYNTSNRSKTIKVEKEPKKSIKKNYAYNLFYQIIVLIIPLITTPYLSRILGVEGVGQFSFTNSITYYFTLLAAFGFGMYGSREIAKYQADKQKQTNTFWEIIIVRFGFVLLSIGLFIALLLTNTYGSYTNLMWYWLIAIASTAFDIVFIFEGNEEFKKIVVRNVIIKVLSLMLIFLLVKTPNDVWIYILCFTGSTLLGNISLWFYLPKFINKLEFKQLNLKKHLLPSFRLFLPTIAISMYTMLDKTLIGLLIKDTYVVYEEVVIDGVKQTIEVIKKYSDLENGYYEQAEKITKIFLTIVTSLGTVMIPRNSKEYAEGNMDKLKNNIYKATNYVWLIGVPMTLGLAAIAPNFIPWFLGNDFNKCVILIQIFSPLLLIIGFSNVFGLQFLVPTKNDTKYTISIITASVLNVVLNLILIPFFWSFGAIIASIISELLVTILMGYFVRKQLNIKMIWKQSIKYVASGLFMFFVVYFLQSNLDPSAKNTFICVLVGMAIYFLTLVLLHDDYFFIALKYINKKIKRS